MATKYLQLSHRPPESAFLSTTVVTNEADDDNDVPNSFPKQAAFGQPSAKSWCDWIDVLTLITTFACLTVSVVIVDPKYPYAWSLRYNNRLIVLGFMLAIMNLCVRRVATRFFIIIETQWGKSTLQNVDAIVRQSIFVPQTSVYWVLVILVLTALPLGLSVAYKSFDGGSASQLSTGTSIKQYGLFGQPYESDQKFVISNAMSSMARFINVATTDGTEPAYAEKPQPFGFNGLLIDNHTSAVLDMPNATTLATIQQGLGLAESLTISADVQATVAIYNASTPNARMNDELWTKNFYGLHTFSAYMVNPAYRLSIAFSRSSADAFIWLGAYRQIGWSQWYDYFDDVSDPEVDAFRSSNMSLLFNIYRQPCSAVWNITSSAVALLEGNCTDVRIPNRFQVIDTQFTPVVGDIFDVYFEAIQPCIDQPDSAWRLPSHTMLAATAYWARWSSYGTGHAVANPKLNLTQDFVYNISNERIFSTRSTLAARPGLYVTLITQPVLTIVFLLLAIVFHAAPIDSGFGLTSILASVDEDSLSHLEGAGLSGRLERPLHLNITVERPTISEQDTVRGRIRSQVSLSRRSTRMRIERGQVYK